MRTSQQLVVGEIYTRRGLFEMFTTADATINAGVFRPKDADSLWLFVTEFKSPHQTQYSGLLDGDVLYWDGLTSARTDHLIIEHEARGLEIHLFYRQNIYQYPANGFRYEGPFNYLSHEPGRPSHFVLRRASPLRRVVQSDLDSISLEEEYFEGAHKPRYTNSYERNPKLRAAAIACHGQTCLVCGFDFGKTYGVRGAGFIEVHHLRPVATLDPIAPVDPRTDMTVVCSNCHRMIHRSRDNVLSLEELRRIMRQ